LWVLFSGGKSMGRRTSAGVGVMSPSTDPSNT
jgi:hypothetical protein